MSDPVAATDPIVPLHGRSNYKTWAQEFEIAARRHGFWNLYTGTEQIKHVPNPSLYQAEVAKAKSGFWWKYWQEQYESDVWEWEEQCRKIDNAMTFLLENIHPRARAVVQQRTYGLALTRAHASPGRPPSETWRAIRNLYDGEVPPAVATPTLNPTPAPVPNPTPAPVPNPTPAPNPPPMTLEIALRNMNDLHLQHCASMRDFFHRLQVLREDLRAVGTEYSDEQCKVKILMSLTPRYAPPVIAELTLKALAGMTLGEGVEYFLAWEEEMGVEMAPARRVRRT
ncbi:hypothetical protein A1O7_01413 [Cladophialophora yegresii CBS 114405]|uniref:DUF4219 domain-containing protein n=1 Tax=Cladophialophora yegresii CBS 114405 TaxID=1182544 RepID=W9WAV7_9EURO|nr:uncharacterized protein A1O7_01413 [Cladophialophora yegresii CBS 114405]EXJ65073.1 hypothetical protein A1O7_01413 [Cladophialophora yegresii CBS 114405]